MTARARTAVGLVPRELLSEDELHGMVQKRTRSHFIHSFRSPARKELIEKIIVVRVLDEKLVRRARKMMIKFLMVCGRGGEWWTTAVAAVGLHALDDSSLCAGADLSLPPPPAPFPERQKLASSMNKNSSLE